jgi:acetyl-CoA synthetase/medium-chain acyl-CoA synthetase
LPRYYNFTHDVMERWAEQRPSALAMWWVDETGREQRKLTFADLAHDFRRAASFFTSLGIRRGDRVLIILHRVPQWWVAVLGLIRIGAIPIPGTPLLTAKDVKYRLEAAEIGAVITDDTGAGKIDQTFTGIRLLVGDAAARPGWTSFDDGVREASPECPYEPTLGDDPSIIYFTSGTAGEAKMVVHTQISYGLGHRITGQYWLDLAADHMIWTLADTGWGKTAWSNLFGPWLIGASIFVMDMRGKFDANLVLRTLSEYPITTFCSPATALRLIIRKDLSVYRFPHLRHCVSAGESLNPPVLSAWQAATGLTIYEGYGQTETVLLVGNFRCLGHEVRPGSMGRPSPGFELGILDRDGNELPADREGELAVRVKPHRPVGLMREYWRNPQGNADRFRGDWYLTGDSARRDADGYYWFVGRADDVINSASYRIGPSEVESALLEHPAVLEAGAIGVPEEMRGEIVKAFVVLREGYEAGERMKHELQQHCKRVTAPYKYPRQIEFVPPCPRPPAARSAGWNSASGSSRPRTPPNHSESSPFFLPGSNSHERVGRWRCITSRSSQTSADSLGLPVPATREPIAAAHPGSSTDAAGTLEYRGPPAG